VTGVRPLLIDDNARAKAERILAYAKKHPYRPGVDPIPGGNKKFCAFFDTYRVVFTYTQKDGQTYRHLTVSVPSDKYPNPIAAFSLAELFGFTGWDQHKLDRAPADWQVGVSEGEHCVALLQAIPKGSAHESN
jgi:hypothetical protein